MDERPSAARGSFRATLTGLGRPGPIEERIGRRLVRLVDPDSEEGRHLFDARDVELIGPEGNALGRIALDEAWERLRRRLVARLGADDVPAIEGLERLPVWATRLGRS